LRGGTSGDPDKLAPTDISGRRGSALGVPEPRRTAHAARIAVDGAAQWCTDEIGKNVALDERGQTVVKRGDVG